MINERYSGNRARVLVTREIISDVSSPGTLDTGPRTLMISMTPHPDP